MRSLVLVACTAVVWLASVASAAANVPVYPAPGARFDTEDVEDFYVDRTASDLPWALVITPGDGGAGGVNGFITHPDDEDEDWKEVDLGWYAAKFNRTGLFSWWVCGYDTEAQEPIASTCTPPQPFYIKFRLSTLTRADARLWATDVFHRLLGYDDTGVEPRCHRLSRTRQRCRVSTYLGDTVFYGRITMWSRRPPGSRAFDLTRYSARLRVYDEYCHMVNNRPLSQCDKDYKSRTGWTTNR